MSVVYDIPIENTGDERIPAFALVEQEKDAQSLYIKDRRHVFKVKQPAEDGSGTLFVGPGVQVDVGKLSSASLSFGVRVLYDDNGGDDEPEVGDTWGGKKDSWKLHKDGTLGSFTILGEAEAGTVRVAVLGGGVASNPEADEILIVANVAAAEWLKGAGPGGQDAVKPSEFFGFPFKRLEPEEEGDPVLYFVDGEDQLGPFENWFTTPVAVRQGFGKIAHIIDSGLSDRKKLMNLDCREVDFDLVL